MMVPIQLKPIKSQRWTILNFSKDTFFYLIIGIFLILFIWKRDIFDLIVALIASSILITFYTPLSKICVKGGSPLYIIPTKNSTISGYTDKQIRTTELFRRGEYHKIEYRKGIIGWIKDEDICKN